MQPTVKTKTLCFTVPLLVSVINIQFPSSEFIIESSVYITFIRNYKILLPQANTRGINLHSLEVKCQHV